jgi:2'-5' RNA ligase
VRVFTAFDVPGRPDWHMTVVFIGTVDAPEPVVAAVDAALGPDAAAGPLSPARFLELPRRHPRVMAVEFRDETGRCGRVQSGVAAALAGAGVVEPERRRWLPHVSIARLRDGDVERPPLEELGFTPEHLVLYRSHLGRGPARYEALHAWPLGSG